MRVILKVLLGTVVAEVGPVAYDCVFNSNNPAFIAFEECFSLLVTHIGEWVRVIQFRPGGEVLLVEVT